MRWQQKKLSRNERIKKHPDMLRLLMEMQERGDLKMIFAPFAGLCHVHIHYILMEDKIVSLIRMRIRPLP